VKHEEEDPKPQAMCVFEDVEESLEGLVQKKFGPTIL
jgi:hypothetical protein